MFTDRPGHAAILCANKKVGSRPLGHATVLEALQYNFPAPKTQGRPNSAKKPVLAQLPEIHATRCHPRCPFVQNLTVTAGNANLPTVKYLLSTWLVSIGIVYMRPKISARSFGGPRCGCVQCSASSGSAKDKRPRYDSRSEAFTLNSLKLVRSRLLLCRRRRFRRR